MSTRMERIPGPAVYEYESAENGKRYLIGFASDGREVGTYDFSTPAERQDAERRLWQYINVVDSGKPHPRSGFFRTIARVHAALRGEPAAPTQRPIIDTIRPIKARGEKHAITKLIQRSQEG